MRPKAAIRSGPSLKLRPSLSVSETTPQGALHQHLILGMSTPSASTSTNSVEPPPMSKMRAGPSPGSSRRWQPSMASRASSSGEMMSSAMPVSCFTRSTKWRPLTARRHASVATERASETRRRRSLSAQTPSAATARSIAASPILPLVARPSPSRTTREKASITVKPSSHGWAISSRQLLVPRSSAP